MAFKIGSINMFKFGMQKEDETKKRLDKIAEVILGAEIDILALQEVFQKEAVELLVREHLPGWDYIWQVPQSNSPQAAEGYAFIWNAKRFRIATGQKREERRASDTDETTHRKILPKIYNCYDEDEHLYKGKLVRDPLYARFESVYGWYEVRLINTHILYNSKETEDNEGDKEKRRRELQILMEIYCNLSNKQYRNGRPSYTFLVGDYNLSLNDIAKMKDAELVADEVLCEKAAKKRIKDRNGTVEILVTVQQAPTTLKKKAPEDAKCSSENYANSYDHFTYDHEMYSKRRIDMQVERIDTLSKAFWEGDVERHRKEFSDHVPIKLKIEL